MIKKEFVVEIVLKASPELILNSMILGEINVYFIQVRSNKKRA